MTRSGPRDAPDEPARLKASRPGDAADEAARLKAMGGALREAAARPSAKLRPLLDTALAELDGVAETLAKARNGQAANQAADPSDAPHAERRLLQAVFQQTPMALFLLGLDGTVRRANSAAAQLVGSGPGYLAGKPFTAFVDLAGREAVQSEVAAVVRTGEIRTLRCGVLTAEGIAECEVTVSPVQARGNSGQLMVAVTAPGTAPDAPEPQAAGQPDSKRRPGDRALRAATRRLDLATAATRILLENVNHSESVAMQRFARLLARELAAWVILDVERSQRLRRQLAVGPEDQPSEELARAVAEIDPSPGSALEQVHESGISVLVAHAQDPGILGDGPDGTPLLLQLGATSVLCAPLSDGERTYGVLTLARPADRGHFAMADVGLVEELGEQLALAMRAERTLRHRAQVADALQASLLPRQPRQIPGAELAASHASATRARDAGTDFYDIYPARSGWGISIGDVCGTGQDAAAVTAAARHAIRVLAHWDAEPAGVLRSANEIMMEEEFGARFVTASVGHLRWRDGRLHVVLASAGHPWPILVRPDGRTQSLPGGGVPLGIFSDADPATQELDLDPGDLLFFFTDGLTSACGPDMVYFENRIADELAALAGEPPARVVSRIEEVLVQFCGGLLHDDVTMLALRAGDPPAD